LEIKLSRMDEEKFSNNLTKFLNHIDSIKETLPFSVVLFAAFSQKAKIELNEFIDKKTDKITKEDGKEAFKVKLADQKVYEALQSNAVVSSLAGKVISSSLFVSLISQYDAYLNRLLRYIFKLKPEILNGSEKRLVFSQLMEFGTIEKAREYIIEKEVETVLRKNHSEHFDYLENKLGIELRKNLPAWSTFIEITERRNLLVHCDGVISNQYVAICTEHKCLPQKAKVGQTLTVSVDYFFQAYECLYEISSKLTHTLWRKLIPEELEEADESLNGICYDLIQAKSYDLSAIMLDFAVKQRKHSDEHNKNIFIVNAALCQFLKGELEEAKKIMMSKDWSSASDIFKLANSILVGDNSNAFKLMLKIGSDGDVKKDQYQQWPLFLKLREEKKFKETYNEIFKEEFKIIEIPDRPLAKMSIKGKENKSTKDKAVLKK